MNLNFFKNSNNTVTINGQTYSGYNIKIDNNQVYVDGKLQTQSLSGPITVTVNGDCASLNTVSGDVVIQGNVSGNVVSTSGDVDIKGSVSGNINTVSGDVSVSKHHSEKINTISGDIIIKG